MRMFLLLFLFWVFQSEGALGVPSPLCLLWKQAPWLTPTTPCREGGCGMQIQPPQLATPLPRLTKVVCTFRENSSGGGAEEGRGEMGDRPAVPAPKSEAVQGLGPASRTGPAGRSSWVPEEPLTHASNRAALVSGRRVVLWECSL